MARGRQRERGKVAKKTRQRPVGRLVSRADSFAMAKDRFWVGAPVGAIRPATELSGESEGLARSLSYGVYDRRNNPYGIRGGVARTLPL